ncbi:peroxidase 2 precursor [Panicum miliaceum]|uniref:Peroxidase 2 n=1 Tax=Panicum miliaceum TaxID=4540 RepID=A0A3L6TDC2_PANMI|nr:peroxidase 2 precursor [Panicum miliaceum]
MVALSGGHTIGQAQCRFFRDHIYNDTNINSTFASSLQGSCPPGERQRRRHPGAAGRDVAHRVRQRLLLQPAKSEGAPALGPGALERRQHRRDGPELRVQRVGVQQRLCGGDGEDGEHQPQDGEPGPGQERLLQGQLLISIDC